MTTTSAEALKRLSEISRWVRIFGRDQDTGKRLVFVYDTDVLTMYMRPRAASNYCAMMRPESSARADVRKPESDLDSFGLGERSLAEILGNYLVWGRADPALNSPAHADELENSYHTAYVKAVRDLPQIKDFLADQFRQLALRHDEQKEATHERTDLLQKDLNAVVDRLWAEFEPLAQSMRLHTAASQERIFSIDAFRIAEGHSAESFFPSPYDSNTEDFLQEVNDIARQVEKMLYAGASFSEIKHRRIWNDALAVAHVCWLNTQLTGIQSDIRIRYVSGTSYILKLCSNPDEGTNKVPAPVRDAWQAMLGDFQDAIRHPLAFIDEDGFRELLNFDGMATDGGRLGDWLRGRLPERSPIDPEDYDAAESGAGGAPGVPPIVHSSSHSRIELASKELASILHVARARQMVSPESSWIASIAKEGIGPRSIDWSELLEKRLQELLPQFLASLATIQRPVAVVGRGIPRNLPPLIFTHFPECQEFCNRLYEDRGISRLKSAAAKRMLTRVIAGDPSLYTPLLAIALWRASEKAWDKARDIAQTAEIVAQRIRAARQRSLSPSSEDITAPIFGEEASYLLAISRRVTAGSKRADDAPEELAKAFKSIEEADELLEQAHEAGAVPDYTLRKLRNGTERLSNLVAQLLYAKLGTRAERSGSFETLQAAEQRLFMQAFDNLSSAVALLDGSGNNPREIYLIEYMLQEACGIAAQVVLLDRYAVSGLEVFPLITRTWSEQEAYESKIEKLFDVFNEQCIRLESRTANGMSPVVSTLVRTIWTAFSLEFLPNPGVGQSKILREQLEADTDKGNWTAGIDELRTNFLKKIAYRKIRYGAT